MKNPIIKITGAGKNRVSYQISIPRETGSTEIRGGAYFGEVIEIPITEPEEPELD